MKVLATGLQFPEGPIAMSDGSILLVEMARETLSRVTVEGKVEVVARIPGCPNGAAVGPDREIYVCNNGGFSWMREGGFVRPNHTIPESYKGGSIDVVNLETGKVRRLYSHCGDNKLNAPNDLVFDVHGGFWFTDVGKRRPREMDRGFVYWARADGSEIREITLTSAPNGIGLSPDGKTLYVAETETGRLWAWEITGPGEVRKAPWPSPNGGRLVAGLGGFTRFDSLAVASSGNICVAAIESCCVAEISPDGASVRRHHVPDLFVTNICFGGPDLRTAYVTLSHAGMLVAMDWHEPGLRLRYQD